MTDTTLEEGELPDVPQRRLRLDWILPVLFRPKKTLQEIAASDTATWLAPILLLSLLAILLTVVAGPARVQAALSTPPNLPADFQYWAPDAQENFIQANTPNTGALVIYILPGAGALLSVWGGWFIFGAILHLVITFSGGRGSRAADFNLAAWSGLPFALRMLVQTAALLLTSQLIRFPGVSGFFPADASGLAAYLMAMAKMIDLYWLWQVILLVLGVTAGSRMGAGKALGVVLAAVLIYLALAALPGFLLSQVSGLASQGSFF